jgi:hypothetical protein
MRKVLYSSLTDPGSEGHLKMEILKELESLFMLTRVNILETGDLDTPMDLVS